MKALDLEIDDKEKIEQANTLEYKDKYKHIVQMPKRAIRGAKMMPIQKNNTLTPKDLVQIQENTKKNKEI